MALLAAGLAILFLSLRPTGQAATPPTTTTNREAHLERLRAEAIEVARNYFPRKDEAEARGDPSLLDGMFVPNSKLQAALTEQIEKMRAKGEVLETRSRTEQVEIVSLDETRAQVRFVNVLLYSVLKDINTGQVKKEYETGKQGTWHLFLVRMDDRWLIEGLTSEETLRKEGRL